MSQFQVKHRYWVAGTIILWVSWCFLPSLGDSHDHFSPVWMLIESLPGIIREGNLLNNLPPMMVYGFCLFILPLIVAAVVSWLTYCMVVIIGAELRKAIHPVPRS